MRSHWKLRLLAYATVVIATMVVVGASLVVKLSVFIFFGLVAAVVVWVAWKATKDD